MYEQTEEISKLRWTRCLATETIPPFAAVSVYGCTNEGIIIVGRPDDCRFVYVNGEYEIPTGKYGLVSKDHPIYALCASPPGVDEPFGPLKGSWVLVSGKNGWKGQGGGSYIEGRGYLRRWMQPAGVDELVFCEEEYEVERPRTVIPVRNAGAIYLWSRRSGRSIAGFYFGISPLARKVNITNTGKWKITLTPGKPPYPPIYVPRIRLPWPGFKLPWLNLPNPLRQVPPVPIVPGHEYPPRVPNVPPPVPGQPPGGPPEAPPVAGFPPYLPDGWVPGVVDPPNGGFAPMPPGAQILGDPEAPIELRPGEACWIEPVPANATAGTPAGVAVLRRPDMPIFGPTSGAPTFTAPQGASLYDPTGRKIYVQVDADVPEEATGDNWKEACGVVSAAGTANQVLGMDATATEREFKTITAGTNVTVTHGVGTITIAAAAAGYTDAQAQDAVGGIVASSSTVTLTYVSNTSITADLASSGVTPGTYYPGSFTVDTYGRVTAATGTLGSANQIVGVNDAGTGIEYKTVTAGTNVSVGHSAGVLTISSRVVVAESDGNPSVPTTTITVTTSHMSVTDSGGGTATLKVKQHGATRLMAALRFV